MGTATSLNNLTFETIWVCFLLKQTCCCNTTLFSRTDHGKISLGTLRNRGHR